MLKPVEDEILDIIIRGLDHNISLPRSGVKDIGNTISGIEPQDSDELEVESK